MINVISLILFIVINGFLFANDSLKLKFPLGGEKLVANGDTLISWDGIALDNSMILEYSKDNGTNWNTIKSGVNGGQYLWKNIPPPFSDKCLLRIKQINPDTLTYLKTSTYDINGKDVKWNDAGTKFAFTGTESTGIYDVITKKLYQNIHGKGSSSNCLAWSPAIGSISAGTYLAVGYDDNSIIIWEVTTGLEYKILKGHKEKVKAISWSPEGTQLASGSEDNLIKIWDFYSGLELNTIVKNGDNVESVEWSHNGFWIASGSDDNSVRIFNAATGKQIFELLGHSKWVETVSWKADDSELASASGDGYIKVWNTSTGDLIYTLTGHGSWVRNVLWNSAGDKLITCSDDNTFKIWNLLSRNVERTVTPTSLNGINTGSLIGLSLNKNETELLIASGTGKIELWDFQNYVEIYDFSGHTSGIMCNSWSHDGTMIASASQDKTVKIWNSPVTSGLDDLSEIHILSGHTGWVRCVAWSPDDKKLASTGMDEKIIIWDVETGQSLKTLIGHNGIVIFVDWSPDGTKIATGSSDKTIRIWDLNSGAQVGLLTGHTNDVECVKWSPDGSKIASGSYDMSIKLWDVSSRTELKNFTGHKNLISGICWNSDGTMIASSCYDSTVKIWDINSGSELKTLTGHQEWVMSVDWKPKTQIPGSNSDNIIASGSADGMLKIWDVESGVELKSFFANHGGVIGLDWNPTGSRLISSCNTIKEWVIDEMILQEDLSDSSFSIVEPLPIANDFDFGLIHVNTVKDSLTSTLIKNNGTYHFWIKDIKIQGGDENDFSIEPEVNTTGNFPIEALPDSILEFHIKFHPQSVGIKKSNIVIDMYNDTLIKKIQGESVQPLIVSIVNQIDFGVLEITNSKTITEYAVKNISVLPITVNQIEFIGDDSDQFEILDLPNNFTLNYLDSIRFSYVFHPTKVQASSSIIAFHYNDPSSPATVILKGTGIEWPQMEIYPDTIDFGNIRVGDSKILNVCTVKNKSYSDIIFSAKEVVNNDKIEFSLNDNSGFILLKSDSVFHDFIFRPISLGPLFAKAQFHHSGKQSPVIFNLKGYGTGGKIYMENDSAKVGDVKYLKMKIADVEPSNLIGNTEFFTAKLSLNNSVFFLPRNQYITDNGNNIIELIGKIDGNSKILSEIPVQIALGNDNICDLNIIEFNWTDQAGNILDRGTETVSGQFKVLGLCEEGGVRLFYYGSPIMLKVIGPNPAYDEIKLIVNLIEKDFTSIYLSDLLGNKLKTVFESINETGAKEVNVDLKDISSGVYIISMQTPTEIINERIIVIK